MHIEIHPNVTLKQVLLAWLCPFSPSEPWFGYLGIFFLLGCLKVHSKHQTFSLPIFWSKWKITLRRYSAARKWTFHIDHWWGDRLEDTVYLRAKMNWVSPSKFLHSPSRCGMAHLTEHFYSAFSISVACCAKQVELESVFHIHAPCLCLYFSLRSLGILSQLVL